LQEEGVKLNLIVGKQSMPRKGKRGALLAAKKKNVYAAGGREKWTRPLRIQSNKTRSGERIYV